MHIVHETILHTDAEIAEAERRNKEEEEERRQIEMEEEKEKADRLAAEQSLLEDITATVIASSELETAETVKRNKEEEAIRMVAEAEAIRLEEEIRKAKEEADLVMALLEVEEANATDEARRIAAETHTADIGLLDTHVVVSAEQTEEASTSEGTVSLVPFLPTILSSEHLTSSPTTSSVVNELKGFMTQVGVNVEKNVNLVMKTLAENQAREEERRIKDEERKVKEEFYDPSLAILFDLVKKGEEDRRKEREERRRLEQERLAREAEEETRRREQFQEMLRIAMQGPILRSQHQHHLHLHLLLYELKFSYL